MTDGSVGAGRRGRVSTPIVSTLKAGSDSSVAVFAKKDVAALEVRAKGGLETARGAIGTANGSVS